MPDHIDWEPRMGWRALVLRLALVATCIVAAMIVAPANSQAHSAHKHTGAHSHHVARTVIAVERHDAHVAVSTVRSGAFVEAHAPQLPASAPDHDGKQGCPSGDCCHMGAHACCGVWLSTSIELFAPSTARLIPHYVARGGPGMAPGALPEPPDHLA